MARERVLLVMLILAVVVVVGRMGADHPCED
jgi:uncharacterized protein HemY